MTKVSNMCCAVKRLWCTVQLSSLCNNVYSCIITVKHLLSQILSSAQLRRPQLAQDSSCNCELQSVWLVCACKSVPTHCAWILLLILVIQQKWLTPKCWCRAVFFTMEVHQLHKAPHHMVPRTNTTFICYPVFFSVCLNWAHDYIMTSHCERDSAQHPILFRQHIYRAHTGSYMQDVVWQTACGSRSPHSFSAMQAAVLLDMHSLLLGYALVKRGGKPKQQHTCNRNAAPVKTYLKKAQDCFALLVVMSQPGLYSLGVVLPIDIPLLLQYNRILRQNSKLKPYCTCHERTANPHLGNPLHWECHK